MATELPAGPQVPVANLYYLLCYALNRLRLQEQVSVTALEADATPSDLLAAMLAAETLRLRLRGVPRAYRTVGEDTRAPRGRIAMGATLGRALLPQGRMHCEVSELTADVPFNRALKAGLRALAADPRVDPARRRGLRRHLVAFAEVGSVALAPQALGAASQGRLEPLHRSLLALLELVRLGLPRANDAGAASLPDCFGSPQAMGLLFEDFVRAFWMREQETFKVSKRRVPWTVEGTESDRALLPMMESDVFLAARDRRVLVECKYSNHTLTARPGHAAKLRSAHLYQLGAYLSHLRRTPGPPLKGVLLYAQVERPLALRYRLDGCEVEVHSLDLAQPWSGIDRDLREMIAGW